MSRHGQLNVLTGGHDTRTKMSSHGQLNFFTGGHDTSTEMSSHGQIIYLQRFMSLVLDGAAMDN
jgi:hypothetical protein